MLFRTGSLITLVLALCACDQVGSINQPIHVEANQTVGHRSTVNGSIRLDPNAHAGALETVNGSITLAEGSTAQSVETVNGALDLGAHAKVTGAANTVNGSITLAKGAEIGGEASNVNGDVRLDAAHIGGGIETVSGDITIGTDSRVEGGIRIRTSKGWFNFTGTGKPRIVIGPRAVVEGDMEFGRAVVLLVSDSAKISKVTGATPTMFSGDQPPAG